MVATAQDAMLTAQEQQDNGAADAAKNDLTFAQTFHKFAREYQKSSRISATLTEATPYLQIDVEQLDADAFLLNTPAGTVDLHDGSRMTRRTSAPKAQAVRRAVRARNCSGNSLTASLAATENCRIICR